MVPVVVAVRKEMRARLLVLEVLAAAVQLQALTLLLRRVTQTRVAVVEVVEKTQTEVMAAQAAPA
jgi:hypothetical protein